MNMIRLTQYTDNEVKDSAIYIRPDYIVGIEPEFNAYGEFIHTRVNFVGGGYYTVTETPREILDLINGPYPNHY